MRLSKKNLLVISFMLFSLFFGAGNLIFPPFLGKEAGSNMSIAMIGFLITAVILPILGVVIIAKFNGLEKLASKVNIKFAVVFTIVIFLAIGPGLGIPRAASVPFEMAIKPYLSSDSPHSLFMFIYSLVFFAIALWLSLTPSKLPKRIGTILTPSLLLLILIVFISFIFKGDVNIALPNDAYLNNAFLNGFSEGYLTMDTIAALNFGIVISGTLIAIGIKDSNTIVKYSIKAGIIAGFILSAIYLMLSYMGMATSGIYGSAANGAVILRNIVYILFGDFGAVVIALIFTLACLTTSIGLITSIAKYFSEKLNKISYRKMVIIIVSFSFIISNLGLNTILSISVPILNAIYPISIVLILLGLFDSLYKNNKYIYPITITTTGVISFIYALDVLNVPLGFIGKTSNYILGYKLGFGWVSFAIVSVILSILLEKFIKQKKIGEE